MAANQTTEAQKIAATTTANYATFDGGIQQCYISADGDCYISFDEQVPVASGNALLIKANLAPVRIDFRGGSVQKVWAIAGGSVSVYLLGVRN
jgi:hypothetical protein